MVNCPKSFSCSEFDRSLLLLSTPHLLDHRVSVPSSARFSLFLPATSFLGVALVYHLVCR